MYPDIFDWTTDAFLPEKDFQLLDDKIQYVTSEDKWTPAPVYRRSERRHVMNTDQRRHHKYIISDHPTLSLFGTMIEDALSRRLGPDTIFWLRQSHMDVLFYIKGEYFRPHSDFIKFLFPDVRMYVLLLGIIDCVSGGHTIVSRPDDERVCCQGSCLKNRACFFPAHLQHEGALVQHGEKMCLKVDVFICSRRSPTMTITIDTCHFSFFESWWEGYDSFFKSMARFSKKKQIVMESVSVDDFQLLYNVFCQKLDILDLSEKEMASLRELWDLFFPDMSMSWTMGWMTCLGWLQQDLDDTFPWIWTHDMSFFLSFYNAMSDKIEPCIAIRYRDEDFDDGWLVPFAYQLNPGQMNTGTMKNIMAQCQHECMSVLDEAKMMNKPTKTAKYVHKSQYLSQVIFDIEKSLQTSIIVSEYVENSTRVSGSKYISEWCNDDYYTEKVYAQYWIECVFGFQKKKRITG